MEVFIVIVLVGMLTILNFDNLIYLAVGKTPEEAIRLKEKGFFNLLFSIFKRVI